MSLFPTEKEAALQERARLAEHKLHLSEQGIERKLDTILTRLSNLTVCQREIIDRLNEIEKQTEAHRQIAWLRGELERKRAVIQDQANRIVTLGGEL